LFKSSPWGHKRPNAKGTYFYIGLYSENLKMFFSRTTWPISTKLGGETCLGDGDSDLFK